MQIPLISGDPERKPASFSRFVLPFAYRLMAVHMPDLLRWGRPPATGSWDHIPRWEVATDDIEVIPEPAGAHVPLRQRVRYFTVETAEVLFGPRTRRLRLRCNDQDLPPALVTAGGVKALLAAPELVLFECSPGDRKACDVLRMGLLVLSVHFAENELDSTRLMRFNDAFRNFREPFPGYPPGPPDLRAIAWLSQLRTRSQASTHNPDAPYQRLWLDLLEAPLLLDGHAYQIFDGETAARARENLQLQDVLHPGAIIHADYRAHTWTAAVAEDGACCLNAKPSSGSQDSGQGVRGILQRWMNDSEPAPQTMISPAARQGWLRLLNVDAPGSGSAHDSTAIASDFHVEWARQHTYMRWAPETLYGFTPHSGAAWLPAWTEPPVWNHFRQLYFDQVCLMLYLRSTIFGFSREISALSRNMQRGLKKAHRDFSRLELQFSLFTNLYQFPLLSHQQQALEMYAPLRSALQIDEYYSEVQDEIRHMADVFDRRHDSQIRSIGVAIAIIATLGVVWDDLGLGDFLTAPTGLGLYTPLALLFVLIAVALGIWAGLRWLERQD